MELKGEAGGRAGLRQLRPPPDRDRRRPPGRAARVAGDGRLVVAFQPHLVSRTRIFGPAMGEALGAADEVVVLDVYLAREDADPEVTGGWSPTPCRCRPTGSRSCPSSPTRRPRSWPGPARVTSC